MKNPNEKHNKQSLDWYRRNREAIAKRRKENRLAKRKEYLKWKIEELSKELKGQAI